MKSLYYGLFLIITITLVGCQKTASDNTVADKTDATPPSSSVTTETGIDKPDNTEEKEDIIATINDKDLTMKDFEIYVGRRMQEDPSAMSNPAAMLNELINKELLLQEAITKGYDKQENVAILIQQETEGIIVSALVQDQLSNVDLSEPVLKAEYDKQISEMVLNEYKGRHILVATEEEANAVIAELDKGTDFAELAKIKSTGPSAAKGGDLGWFQADAMVPPFADALKSMATGDITKTPVKTRFGYHVIKLEDDRELDKPDYEESKEKIKAILANKAAQDYLKGLRDNAKIDIKNPETGATTPVTTQQLDDGATR